jgi:hypothetical protein
MEINDNDLNSLSHKDKQLIKIVNNSKLDIFQDNNYCYRNNNTIPFENSYEHIIIQNNAANCLNNSSNLTLYAMNNGYVNNLYAAQKRVKRFFYDTEQNAINGVPQSQVENDVKKFKYDFVNEKLKDNNMFIHLKMLIERPNLFEMLKTNKVFVLSLISHPYFEFHPRHEEILKYLKENEG